MAHRRPRILIAVAGCLALLVALDRFADVTTGVPTSRVTDDSALVALDDPQNPIAGDIDTDMQQLENPLSRLSRETLNQTIERPIFAPNRRPPQEAKPVVQPEPPRQKPQPKPNPFKLLGIVQTGQRTIALLNDKRNNRHFRVEVGDQIDGWTVSHVDALEMTMNHGGRTVILTLSEK